MTENAPEMQDTEEEKAIDVSIAKDGGVTKRFIEEAPEDARGPPPKGTTVTAHYTGKYMVCQYYSYGLVADNKSA